MGIVLPWAMSPIPRVADLYILYPIHFTRDPCTNAKHLYPLERRTLHIPYFYKLIEQSLMPSGHCNRLSDVNLFPCRLRTYLLAQKNEIKKRSHPQESYICKSYPGLLILFSPFKMKCSLLQIKRRRRLSEVLTRIPNGHGKVLEDYTWSLKGEVVCEGCVRGCGWVGVGRVGWGRGWFKGRVWTHLSVRIDGWEWAARGQGWDHSTPDFLNHPSLQTFSYVILWCASSKASQRHSKPPVQAGPCRTGAWSAPHCLSEQLRAITESFLPQTPTGMNPSLLIQSTTEAFKGKHIGLPRICMWYPRRGR